MVGYTLDKNNRLVVLHDDDTPKVPVVTRIDLVELALVKLWELLQIEVIAARDNIRVRHLAVELDGLIERIREDAATTDADHVT